MALNTVQRTLDVFPAVALQLNESSSDGSVTLLIRVTAAADVATGFSQYNQEGLLHEDNN